MVDLQFMKLPLSGDFSVFKLLFGMACACLSIASVFASTELVGPALATSLEASRGGGVDMQPLVAALRPAALVTLGWNVLYYNLLGSQVWTLAVVRCGTRSRRVVSPQTPITSFYLEQSRY